MIKTYVKAFIGLGSNLGERERTIKEAIKEIKGLKGVHRLVKASSLYETEPVSIIPQPYFINSVVEIQTKLSASDLLQKLFLIEKKYGRIRDGLAVSRTLDLDLLFYGDQIIQEKELSVPHPRLHLRKFVLIPMAEIAPLWLHPLYKKTVQELLAYDYSSSKVSILPEKEEKKSFV